MANAAGVDVSRWQGAVDWNAVRAAGIEFAIIRASVGDFYSDERFEENWEGTKAAGIYRSAYHVLRPDQDPVVQIDRFESVVGGPGDLPHVLDVELDQGQPNSVIRQRTQACLELLAVRFGRQPLVYSADWFWTPRIGDQPWVDDYDLWVAHYYWPQVTSPRIPAGWMVWRIWQHSNKGSVPGIAASVDLNWFAGDSEDLRRYAGGEEPPPPPAPPDLGQRVQNLENWAGELDDWARGEGYDGVEPDG